MLIRLDEDYLTDLVMFINAKRTPGSQRRACKIDLEIVIPPTYREGSTFSLFFNPDTCMVSVLPCIHLQKNDVLTTHVKHTFAHVSPR